ncbi:hypothetical protein, partial [Methylophaga sp. UBA4204]|uniref:hypothetical protein n=1 Tax=Methylophaga sp. UBA4204 TaxID=1946892 RepID=UPI0025FD8B94
NHRDTEGTEVFGDINIYPQITLMDADLVFINRWIIFWRLLRRSMTFHRYDSRLIITVIVSQL